MNLERCFRWAAACALGVGTVSLIFAACTSPGAVSMSATQSQCMSGALKVLFSPMYSAYDGTHTFQIPAVVDGINTDTTPVTWTASDPSMVKIEHDPTTGGAMITTQKSGMVTITAQAGNLCGSSVLTITAAEESDWETGNARYNNGVALKFGRRGEDGGMDMPTDGGVVGPACTNCHGPTAMSGPFKSISHTPEQTGGFSDQDLVGIVTNGVVPDGGYFDNSIIPYSRWQELHHWSDLSADQQRGLIVYLRSLTPVPQMGSANFGGRRRGDGGPDMGPPMGPPPGDQPDAGNTGGGARDAGVRDTGVGDTGT